MKVSAKAFSQNQQLKPHFQKRDGFALWRRLVDRSGRVSHSLKTQEMTQIWFVGRSYRQRSTINPLFCMTEIIIDITRTNPASRGWPIDV